MTMHTSPNSGLDGVTVAATALSHVDGEAGQLIIAGARVDDLAARDGYEALAARLWSLGHDRAVSEAEASRWIGQARLAVHERLPVILPATAVMPPVAAFRAALAVVTPVEGIPHEATLAGASAVLAAALVRQAEGLGPVVPDPSLGQAADMLRMMRGRPADDAQARALQAYLVTVSDHGMNASTFAGRVVASTGADLFMAATAAYCALSGPLHGGAPEPVLDMLDAIGASGNIAPWIDGALSRGERLMGFGHRVYKVRDPRADVLKTAVGLLGERDLGFAAEVEAYARAALERAKPGRRLDTNVEFYTAILLDALAIPRKAFTPVFATGRMLGWTAHAIEQQRTGRLLRPSSAYVGPLPAMP